MTGAPLPLLGTFHEISIAVPDVRAAVEFYERLGFTQATTTDAFTHPYGVLTDGRLFIGLHQRPGPSPILTFVRPGIAASLGAFAAAGIHLTSCHVGEEVFNEIAFADPSGQTVAVLEARTYSPVARAVTDTSLWGAISGVNHPAPAREFWEPLGFVAADETSAPYPHLTLFSDHLDLAFHQPGLSARALLVFRGAGMAAHIERLRELGLGCDSAPAIAGGQAASGLLHSPDGTALLLLEE
jgi:catechol 2,3-dioxygenase-like lactoylglutathione lyase family enzyme